MRRRFLFNAMGDTGWLVLLALAVIVAGVCIWLLYRYERKLISRRLGWTLLALRLLTVSVVFLTLLEPVLVWTVDREKTGRVVLSVDVSDSMNTADRHADKAERLRWLRATGMIGNAAVNDRLDRYLEAFKNDREPDWIDSGEGATDAERAEIAADRKAQLEELLKAAGELPRKEIARRLITGGITPLDEQIEELALIERQVFAGQATAVDATSLEDRIKEPGAALRTESSNLLKGVTPVAGESSNTPIAGIVLFTDGRDNMDDEDGRLLQRLASLGVPIYPVVMGSQQRPRDLAIGQVDYPRSVFREDKGIIKAELRTTGFEQEEVTVVLEQVDHPEAVQRQTIRPDDRTVDITFEIPADEVGRQQFTLSIESDLPETRDDNNEKSFSIKVLDEVADESKVLVLEGDARWEFRFLNSTLTRDHHVTLETVVFRQPYLGLLPGTFFPREFPLPTEEESRAAKESMFGEYDVVIIGDVPEAQLPRVAWQQLDKFVSEEGGTLVMTAGKRHFPMTYQSPILDALLPVTGLSEVRAAGRQQTGPPHNRGFHLRLTPDGARQEMFQFDFDALENHRIWRRLPGHSWALKGKTKPAATVYAALKDPTGNDTLAFERGNAIMAHNYVGAGQTVWVGIDSTWRWRSRGQDKHHARFWGQLCRWAARFKASAGNEYVRFGLEQSEVDVGDDVIIRARWEERFLNQHPDIKARAEIRPLDDPDGPALMTIDLMPVDTRPQIHEATVASLDPGEYEVRLVALGIDLSEEPIVTELSVAERLTTELAELSANRNLLEQMAEVTGGRVFFPDEVDQIPAMFQEVSESEHSREEIALWDHWLVLILCCGLLTTEWVLRKLNGLP